jgi:hypothetical protein
MNRLKHFWPLGIPLAIGAFLVVALLALVRSSVTGSDLEGALLVLALGGMGASIALPIVAVGTIVAIAKQWFVPFPVYAALLFVTLLPVAYFQCVNQQTSLMPFLWAPLHIAAPDFTHLGSIVALDSSLYVAAFAVVATGSYAFCRRWM